MYTGSCLKYLFMSESHCILSFSIFNISSLAPSFTSISNTTCTYLPMNAGTTRLQYSLGIRRTSNARRNVQYHTRKEECVLVDLFTPSRKFASIKEFSYRQAPTS